METNSRILRSPLVTALKYAVSLALLAVLASQVDGPGLRKAVSDAGILPFVVAIVLAAAAYPLCAIRWWWLLRTTHCPLPFRRAHAVVWIGQFYNAFLPGGIGGDATRLAYAFRDHPNRRAAAATATAADRLIGFAVLLLMATGGLLVHALSGRLPSNGLAVVGALGLCVILVGAGVAALPWLASKLPEPWARPLLQLRGDVRGTLFTAALSAGVWILDFASGWVLARALGLSLGPVEVGSALAVAYTSALLPISLGGHGVREGALVLTLLWIAPDAGLAADDLSAFALLFLATSLACSGIGGLVLLGGKKPPAPAG
jgi:uncharacterized membrane protein YbhN (UPF0104 family)